MTFSEDIYVAGKFSEGKSERMFGVELEKSEHKSARHVHNDRQLMASYSYPFSLYSLSLPLSSTFSLSQKNSRLTQLLSSGTVYFNYHLLLMTTYTD